MKIVDYCVQCHTVYDGKDVLNFQDGVKVMLREGWQPYGDLVISTRENSNSVQFCQAMVKYEEDADYIAPEVLTI